MIYGSDWFRKRILKLIIFFMDVEKRLCASDGNWEEGRENCITIYC